MSMLCATLIRNKAAKTGKNDCIEKIKTKSPRAKVMPAMTRCLVLISSFIFMDLRLSQKEHKNMLALVTARRTYQLRYLMLVTSQKAFVAPQITTIRKAFLPVTESDFPSPMVKKSIPIMPMEMMIMSLFKLMSEPNTKVVTIAPMASPITPQKALLDVLSLLMVCRNFI